jgi:5-methylcytosine-specific restriction endonuclease McrA
MKKRTNFELLNNLKTLVGEERKILAEILENLREVESRKLFLDLGYPSLFEFCVKELGYSEGSAQRRISAMRLVKTLPVIEEKIVTGRLSLSVISQAQSFFKRQEKEEKGLDVNQKLSVLKSLENTSTRECERILCEMDPELPKEDKTRIISSELTELRLTVNKEFMDKIKKAKDLLSHSNPHISIKELLEMTLDQLISKKDPALKKERVIHNSEAELMFQSSKNLPPAPAVTQSLKGQVWRKSNSQCCYVSLITQKRCSATRFLEIDHIVPKSKGGPNTFENLQLLCDLHNRQKGTTYSRSWTENRRNK